MRPVRVSGPWNMLIYRDFAVLKLENKLDNDKRSSFSGFCSITDLSALLSRFFTVLSLSGRRFSQVSCPYHICAIQIT